jgi:hypothetical protein
MQRVQTNVLFLVSALFEGVGCAHTNVGVPVAAPQVRVAADAIAAGATRARLRDENGIRHEVDATSTFTCPLDSEIWKDTEHRDGRWTLGQIAAACAPAASRACPTDDPIFAYNKARGQFDAVWLSTVRLTADRQAVRAGIISAFSLAAGTGFVVAQATCFSSWCGPNGKRAFIAADIAVGAAALGLTVLIIQVGAGLAN